MSMAALVRSMSAAGASPEAIALAIEAVEAAADRASAVTEERKRKDRERKAAQKRNSMEFRGTSTEIPETSEEILPPALTPFAPPMRDKNSTPPQTPIPPSNQIAREASFDRFWRIWPNKVGRPAARRAYDKHWLEELEIIAGVERYILEKPPDRPWLNPATFLNQERWKDQPAKLPQLNGFNHAEPDRSVHAALERVHDKIVSLGDRPGPLLLTTDSRRAG